MNDVDERISAALRALAGTVQEPDLRPLQLPRRRPVRWVAPLLAAAAVLVVVVTIAVVSGSPNASHKQQQPGGPSPSPSATTSAPTSAPPSGSTTVSPPPRPELDGAEPLWPFASAAEAYQWESVDGPNGHSPWHADAKMTALSFATGYLHFHDITEVTSSDIQGTQADIGVGYDLPSGDKHTASVVHLARYGDENAPWEVVAASASDFSISEPASGVDVTSPMTVGGRITGVDDNITVAVRTLDGQVDKIAPVPAGGQGAPWTVTVPFSEQGVLTVVASTGGHLTQHERFVVVGVTAGS